jgi:hypothetical protein
LRLRTTADEILFRCCFDQAATSRKVPGESTRARCVRATTRTICRPSQIAVRRLVCDHQNKSREYSSVHVAMCEAHHAPRSEQGATMCADSRQGKPTERWRRKVSGLTSHSLHDSGTAEIQSALWAASVQDDASYRWWK